MLVLAISRAWVWPALAALVGGLLLVGRVVAAAVAALPAEARDEYRAAWRRTWRPFSAAGVVLAWTLVYALYSLSLPVLGPLRELAGPSRPPAADVADTPAPTYAPVGSTPVGNRPVGRSAVAPADEPAEPAAESAPPVLEPVSGAPCSAAALGQTTRELQAAAEAFTGHPIGADLSLVVEALAGCGDAENAALSLLGPVNQILNDAGIPLLPLPATPDLTFPRVPEAVAAPLRPAVFQACAQVQTELLTVTAVAPVARISTDDTLQLLRYVTEACRAFAPERTS